MNYRSFTKAYPCNIDSFKTVTFESKMRPETFKTETETRKKGLKTKSQKTSSLQIIQQICRIKKVVKFIDLQKLLSFYGATIFLGCPYA